MKTSDKWQVAGDKELRAPRSDSCHLPLATRHLNAFTLIELLVVISILGILAALTVPALKNIGKSDSNISASRQLLDGVGRARQLAMANRTTVYMVFVPTNFWDIASGTFNNAWWINLTSAQQTAATNLCDKQLTGYNFISHGTLGDQPGQHAWSYLAQWQNLPDGAFIAWQKFYTTNTIVDQISGAAYPISEFSYANNIPFPTETATNNSATPVMLPYIAFNYLGQLTFDGQNLAGHDEYIPLAQGSVVPAIDVATGNKSFVISQNPSPNNGSPAVSESPPGNSTNISYNIVHIDALTGRAVLEHHKVQ